MFNPNKEFFSNSIAFHSLPNIAYGFDNIFLAAIMALNLFLAFLLPHSAPSALKLSIECFQTNLWKPLTPLFFFICLGPRAITAFKALNTKSPTSFWPASANAMAFKRPAAAKGTKKDQLQAREQLLASFHDLILGPLIQTVDMELAEGGATTMCFANCFVYLLGCQQGGPYSQLFQKAHKENPSTFERPFVL